MLQIRAQALLWLGLLSPLLMIVAETVPPTDADCVNDRPFPDPLDCTNYYQCFDIGNGSFVLVDLNCPPDGHFDEASESCIPGPCKKPPTDVACVDERTFPDPVNCTNYYQCYDVFGNGTVILFHLDCPSGAHFDASTDKCVWGPCENEEYTTEIMRSTTDDPTTEDTEPPVNSTTIDPDACDHDCEYVGIDCHNYYTCIDFQRKEYHECSEESGLAFNRILKVCDRIENVEGCRPDPPTTTESSCGCEYRAHETDCRKYYFCPNSCKKSTCQQRTCPGGLLWSVDFYQDGTLHQQCALPSHVTCAPESSSSTTSSY